MKGIVFTEFMDHVDSAHGPIVLEEVVTASGVKSGGAYTSVGTYPCADLVKLIGATCARTGQQSSDVIRGFGEQLAVSFKRDHPHYFEGVNYFDFVEGVERRIHVDVLKLYPDAELPRFITVSRTDEKLVIDYLSARALEELAMGLLIGTARHFGEDVSIEMEPFENNDTRFVRFEIQRT